MAESSGNILQVLDGTWSLLIVGFHLPKWTKEIRESVSAIVFLGMCAELEDFVRCTRQILMLQILGKLKPEIKEGKECWPLDRDHSVEISVTGRYLFHISM